MTNVIDDLNPNELIMDPKHPGINDLHYINRRKYFFNLGREYRLNNKGLPLVEYEATEHEIWRYISNKLKTAHEQKACQLYLTGKEKINFPTDYMPQLHDLNLRLQKEQKISITPAEGLLHTRTFFSYLSQRSMPVTQFIRHAANPEYTPEPDAVHDAIGHIPTLMDKDFIDIVELIGKGVAQANDDQLVAWQRIYWFSMEFGLIKENDDLKVFGAGILSSFGEMEYCYSDQVTRLPFELESVINTPYDPTCMQETIFIISSMADLKKQVLQLTQQMGS